VHIEGLDDSKKLTPAQRVAIANDIRNNALAYGVGFATHEEIDDINILQADFLAMRRALVTLSHSGINLMQCNVIVDGSERPGNLDDLVNAMRIQCVVKADAKYPCVMAASILAKVEADAWLSGLPEAATYEWAKNSGYATKRHLELIQQHGRSSIHRQTFEVKGI
jgi:ribonuclease HII